MHAQQRARLDAFVASGQQPTTTARGTVLARQGVTFQTLVSASGEHTAAGAYFEQVSQQVLPVGGFDPAQAPARPDDTEYIAMRDGTQCDTRRWDPAWEGVLRTPQAQLRCVDSRPHQRAAQERYGIQYSLHAPDGSVGH